MPGFNVVVGAVQFTAPNVDKPVTFGIASEAMGSVIGEPLTGAGETVEPPVTEAPPTTLTVPWFAMTDPLLSTCSASVGQLEFTRTPPLCTVSRAPPVT